MAARGRRITTGVGASYRTRRTVRTRANTAAKWKGRAKLKRLLQRLPDTVRLEIAKLFEEQAPAALAFARASTPKRTGALAAALRVKTYSKSLRMRLGLFGKADNSRFFYGRILDRGRRAQTARAKRRNASGAVTAYTVRVSALPAARFDIVYGRVAAYVRNLIGVPAKDIFAKALRAAGAGGGADGD
jgi:hypothetical protein